MTAEFGAYLVNSVLTHTRPFVSDPHPIGSPGTGLGPCKKTASPRTSVVTSDTEMPVLCRAVSLCCLVILGDSRGQRQEET